MIQGKKVLAVIPARGGSKGVPRKNIREVAGKPLIAYTIECANKAKYPDKIVVSSEDSEILSKAHHYGAATLIRPVELSQDETPGVDPVLHAIEANVDYDYVVLLQPTSPLRIPEDVDTAIQLCISKNYPACVSVCHSQESPYWMFTIPDGIRLKPLLKGTRPARRQDLPSTFVLNGAVYVAEIEWLKKTKDFISDQTIAYVMPNDRSLDIDTESDLQHFEALLRDRVAK
ncbi:MAG: cytidylyltransferase domain-containing protein [Desulfomonilaceae bacterium]